MLLNQTIRLFLDSIGRREEYEFYLNKFQSAGAGCFALLVPDTECLEQAVEALVFDLHFLLKLGLIPAVVLCGNQAEAGWNLLQHDPLFDRIQMPAGPLDRFTPPHAGRIPVFVEPDTDLPSTLSSKIPGVARRVHFIRAGGGLGTDYVYLQKLPAALPAEDRVLADTAAILLNRAPATHISVTSPINLLREIFTIKGAGTVFRKGSEILCGHPVDRQRLHSLLQESFGRTPKPAALDSATHIYWETAWRGAVLLEQHPVGLYLSKFAVGPEARGEGLAQELWEAVCKNHPSFFWRSRKGNPINQWYDRQADGRHGTMEWMIFWRGANANALPGMIAFCESRPSDFEEPGK